jgi:DNA-binding GntR family transcriptional regulator
MMSHAIVGPIGPPGGGRINETKMTSTTHSEVYLDTRGHFSARQEVSDFLRARILTGHFPAGHRLKTSEIAQLLGVSRMPVRDALQVLHSEGLVVLRPNRGAVVTSLTTNDIVDHFEMRAVLEGLAARVACQNFSDAVLDDLELIVIRMDGVRHERQMWLDYHAAFHESLLNPCGRPRLMQQIRHVSNALLPYLRIYVASHPEMEVQGTEHAMILNVARRRNPELLEVTMRDHIVAAGRGVVEFVERTSLNDSPSAGG